MKMLGANMLQNLLILFSCMYISLSFPLTKSKRDVTTILNINILPPENKMPEKNTEEYRNYVKGNWKSGECNHELIFNGAETIRRFKYYKDKIAFGLISGRLCLVNMETGLIYDKYNKHKGEITAIDYDGKNLCSGGADGTINIYKITFSESSDYGNVLYTFPKLFSRTVSGIKLIPSDKSISNTLIVACGLDRQLVGIHAESGKILYKVELNSTPLCVDEKEGYLALGTLDGRVLFVKAATGKVIMQFQAHRSKIRSINMMSQRILLTGGSDGIVKRWDLSVEVPPKSPAKSKVSSVQEPKPEPVPAKKSQTYRPSRLIDFYLANEYQSRLAVLQQNREKQSNTVKNKKVATTIDASKTMTQQRANNQLEEDIDGTNVQKFQDPKHQKPVVSVQGDEDKILAAYEDGVIAYWDVRTGANLYDITGRSNMISTLQYDSERLVADGTYSILIMNNFAKPPTDIDEEDLQEIEDIINYGDEEGRLPGEEGYNGDYEIDNADRPS